MQTRVLALLFALFTLGVSAGTIDPNTPDSAYVEFGKQFPFVVRLCGQDNDDLKFCASAVVISPDTILTAAHVVKNCKTAKIITADDKSIDINIVIYPEKFDTGKFGYYDIAIGFLKEDIKLEFYPELYTDTDEENKVCTLSGYGMTGTFKTGLLKSDSLRRAGSNTVDSIDRGLLICDPSPSNKNRTKLEFLIASGDSGGGLFIGDKLAGIHSCVISSGKHSPRSAYTDTSGHTRISDHIEWIKQTIRNSKK